MLLASRAPDLVSLDADHPGFHDPEYRQRRNEIARLALEYQPEELPPVAPYTSEEHAVWREVWWNLAPLHERYACRAYRVASQRVNLSRELIPQLRDVNQVIEPIHGFRMLPVAGLVTAGAFLERLDDAVFLSTQYIRHHSVPLYTPEPDVVHELIGHAPTFADSELARLNRAFGKAVIGAAPEVVEAVGRLYWYTLEFGVVREEGELKVYGAGLLSSFGELGRFEREEELEPWDVDRIASTPYDPTHYQEKLFVAPSFARMIADVTAWLERLP